MSTDDEDWAVDSAEPLEAAFELVGYPVHLRGQAVHAGIETGLLDRLESGPERPAATAAELDLDPDATTRLCRALAVYDVLEVGDDGTYAVSAVGERFLADHPESIRDFASFFHHPDRAAAVRHFPEVVADGDATGYDVEFGHGLFEHGERHPAFADAFNGFQDISSTTGATAAVLESFEAVDLSNIETLCDVGGGYGDLLAHLLAAHPHLEGAVLDLPGVVEARDRHWAPKLGVEDRCRYVAGDMFESVPTADAYVLKAILHDWPDDDCVEILETVHDAAPPDARLFVRERLVDPETPLAESVDMDLWMLLETGGRERTRGEYESLYECAGWRLETVHGVEDAIGVMACSKV